METSNRTISEQFSQGNFKEVYAYFANEAEWHIIGDRVLKGKATIIDFCDKMLIEMASSVVTNTNIIEDKNKIAIEGICIYTNKEHKQTQLNYCDTYLFETGKIKTITSYCILLNKE